MGFQHKPITPCYPQANGMAERFNKMLTKVLMTAKVEKRSWKQELFSFLRNYRCTPHSTTGRAPAAILFSTGCFRTKIPELSTIPVDDENIREKDRKNKQRIKTYADKKSNVKKCKIQEGDSVIVKKKGTANRIHSMILSHT